MTDSEAKKRASKFLSLVLRHDPEVAGVTLDPFGYASVASLLGALRARGLLESRQQLDELVATNGKRRFAFDESGTLLRASQGHSIPVDLELVTVKPPPELYHGTVERFLLGIQQRGLEPRSRQYVHLSANRETAAEVGARRGKPLVLIVQSGELHLAGHKFYRSANGVWLTKGVPPPFIAFP